MDSLAMGVLFGIGVFFAFIFFKVLENMQGLKGLILRRCFYTLIVVCLCLAWLHSPEKTENFVLWGIVGISIYSFGNELISRYFDCVEERIELERKRYDKIMKRLEDINNKVDEIKK